MIGQSFRAVVNFRVMPRGMLGFACAHPNLPQAYFFFGMYRSVIVPS